MGYTFDTTSFDRATIALKDSVQATTVAFGERVGNAFVRIAKREAPWTDQKGVARKGFHSSVKLYSGKAIYVRMGGSAPNYKRGPSSASDYMEYLEFAHNGSYAIVYPALESIQSDVAKQWGACVIKGAAIYRDPVRSRARSKALREKRRESRAAKTRARQQARKWNREYRKKHRDVYGN